MGNGYTRAARRLARRVAVMLSAAAVILSSCGGKQTVPDKAESVWHSVTLREYDGAVVREIYPLAGGGAAAVYYDMAAEDYVYDIFTEDGGYAATVRPAEFSGCPKAWKIVPHDGGCLLIDRSRNLWLVSGTGPGACSAERIAEAAGGEISCCLYSGGTAYLGRPGSVGAAGDGGFAIPVPGDPEALYAAGGGILAAVREPSGGLTVVPFSPGGTGKKIAVPDIRFTDLQAAPGHELYLRDRTGILFSDGGRAGRLLDFVPAGVTSEFVSGWAVKDENTVYAAESDYYQEGDVCRLSVVRRGEADETETAAVIRVGCIGLPSDLNIAAAELLREGIALAEIIDYSKKADPQKELRGDILSGKAPDVILLDRVDGRDDYIRSGLFADLAPYISGAGDAALAEAVGPFMTGGKLYELPSEISVGFLAVRQGYHVGKTTDDLIDFCEGFDGAGTRPLPETDPERLLALTLKASIPDLINSGFDSPSFRRLLEFCKDYPSVRCPEDAVPVIREYTVSGYEGYLRMKASMGGDAEVCGYPSVSGSGVALYASSSMAICGSSERKDECWELIMLYRKAVRSRTNEERSLPFAMSDAERAKTLELAGRLEYFFMRGGGEASAFVEDDGSCWLDKYTEADGVRMKVTPEIIDICDVLVSSAVRPGAEEAELAEIIAEEASYYFAGSKTLDETVRIISSRAGMYLAERDTGG